MKHKLLILISFFLLSLSNLYANDVITKIRKIYYETNELIESQIIEPHCFYYVRVGFNLRFIECHQYISENHKIHEEYQVYIHENRVLKTIVSFSSQSGDWADINEFYYHSNDYTAFVFQRFVTYHGFLDSEFDEKSGELLLEKIDTREDGIFITERRLYYDPVGYQVRDLKKTFFEISKSNKRIPVTNSNRPYHEPQYYIQIQFMEIYDHLVNSKLIKKDN